MNDAPEYNPLAIDDDRPNEPQCRPEQQHYVPWIGTSRTRLSDSDLQEASGLIEVLREETGMAFLLLPDESEPSFIWTALPIASLDEEAGVVIRIADRSSSETRWHAYYVLQGVVKVVQHLHLDVEKAAVTGDLTPTQFKSPTEAAKAGRTALHRVVLTLHDRLGS